MGHARHRDGPVLLGHGDQCRLEVGDGRDELADVVSQVQPQIGGDLVVATAPGAQFAAERAQPLQQPAFQRGVHVLVSDGRAELTAGHRRTQVVEREQHPGGLVVAQQPGAMQYPCVRLGRQQVIGRQPPVEVHRHR